jgi:hypothetical protein
MKEQKSARPRVDALTVPTSNPNTRCTRDVLTPETVTLLVARRRREQMLYAKHAPAVDHAS